MEQHLGTGQRRLKGAVDIGTVTNITFRNGFEQSPPDADHSDGTAARP